MPRLQLFFFALAALLLSATQVSAYTDPFICLVNQARAAAGVGPVGWSAALQGVARQVAADMDRTKIVSHFGSDGSNPLTRLQSFAFLNIGENVAGGQSTPKWAMDSFLGSPGHRATLMDSRFNCFGGAGSGDFWAQEYGQSAGGCPVPNCGGYRKIKRDELPAVEIGETFVANVETGVIEIGGATEDAYQGPGDDSTAA